MSDEQFDFSRSMGGEALGARLRRLSERLDRDGMRIYAAHGIYFEQRWYGILRQLMARGPMSVGELASILGVTHASVSESRRSLEKAGVITATVTPDDRRRRTLSLTPHGQQLCNQLAPLWADFNAVAIELNQEAGDVVRLLDQLDDALSKRSLYDRVTERAAARQGLA
jgi:DNA-binding MarR family transcriptional regulator